MLNYQKQIIDILGGKKLNDYGVRFLKFHELKKMSDQNFIKYLRDVCSNIRRGIKQDIKISLITSQIDSIIMSARRVGKPYRVFDLQNIFDVVMSDNLKDLNTMYKLPLSAGGRQCLEPCQKSGILGYCNCKTAPYQTLTGTWNYDYCNTCSK